VRAVRPQFLEYQVPSIGQQIIVSGVGGQGILFVTRVLAEVALGMGSSVLSSETHGMAQRGGTVISHLKVGTFHSPLIRCGRADMMLALKEENVPLHRHFLRSAGLIFVNSSVGDTPGAVDAAAAARELGSPLAANLVLLGFALASGALFCDAEAVGRVLAGILQGSRLELSLKALEAGLEAAK
jgi:indolepyruvate ferredoxin oxidoreductase beta subunit